MLPAAVLQENTTQDGAGTAAGAPAADTAAIGYYSADEDLTFESTFDPFNSNQSDGAIPAIPRWSLRYLRELISSVAGRYFALPVFPAAASYAPCVCDTRGKHLQ